MATILLGATLLGLSAPTHHLSPAGPAHASYMDGPAGERPFSTSRSAGVLPAFLDVEPHLDRFEAAAGETVNTTFQLTERNNVGVSISSFSWRLTTLEGDPVVDGTGSTACAIQLDGRSSTEWSTDIAISTNLFRDMMVQGRDRLRLTVNFQGKDHDGNDLTVSRTIPAHLTHRVAMLVDQDLYPLIKDNLERYERDVNLRGSVEFLYRTGNWGTPEAIRALLKQLHADEGINGAILWGHLPYAMWRFIHSDNSTEDFPIPAFYEDLDGEFIDVEGDGLYDRHVWGENDGCEIWVALVMPPNINIPASNLDPRGEGTGGGLLGSYFQSDHLTDLRLTRVDPELEFYWVADCPPELDPDDFSVAWTGRLKADSTGQYTIALMHGGGVKMWIDGVLVHDRSYQAPWKQVEYLLDLYLTEGWHTIRMEHYENGWGYNYTAAIRLMWTSDSILARTINDWLDRSHAYHSGELEYPERALLFMDWGYGINCRMRDPILEKHIRPLYGDQVMVRGCALDTGADAYIEALDMGHELVSVWSHAGSNYHHINSPDVPPGSNTSATSWKVRRTEAGLVTLIWGCHAGDYGHGEDGTSRLSENLAANYAFSTPHGLAAAGCTRSMGTTFSQVYWAWQNGSSMATGWFAYLDWGYDQQLRERQWPAGGTDRWVEDVVMFGDPFIRIDHRPWNTTVSIDNGAEYTTDGTVTLHVSATDATEMRFKNAGGTWSPWQAFCSTWEFDIGNSYGAHRVYVQTRNDWGVAEYNACDTITLVATMSDGVSVEIGEGDVMTNSTRLTLAMDIGEADTAKVWMSIRDDGSDWSDWSPFLEVTTWRISAGDGERTVSVRFMGDDGIWRAEASDQIIIDTHPPRSSVILEGEMGLMEWYVSPVILVINTTDTLAGVHATEWSLDGSDWTAYTGPLEVGQDGAHRLEYRSSDVCGNVEDVRTVDFKMDCSCPVDLSIAPEDRRTHLNIPSLVLELAADDPMSGLDAMRFRIDGGEWGIWTNFEDEKFMAMPSEEGEHTIDWQVRDMAGNVASLPEPLAVMMDTTTPDIEGIHPAEGTIDVPLDTIVVISFDEKVDGTTLNGMTLLVQDARGIPVAGDIAYDPGTSEVTFTPAGDLDHYTTYRVMLRGEVLDLAGNALRDGDGHSWTFTTVGLPPGAVSDLRTAATNDSIVLSWRVSADPGSGEFKGYNVYRARSDGPLGEEFELVTTVTSPSFEDTSVEPEVIYHYMVRTMTSYAEGPESEVVTEIVILIVDAPEEPEEPVGPGPNDPGDDGDPKTSIGAGNALALIAAIIIVISVFAGVVFSRRRNG